MAYRAICERLEAIDRMLDASESFVQMVNELGAEITSLGEQGEWAVGKRSRIPLHTAL